MMNNIIPVMHANGINIPIDSTRAGLMFIGPGYTDQLKVKDKEGQIRVKPLSVLYRTAILVHEARHSDCTGGLTRADLAVLKQVFQGHRDMEDYNAIDCGHLHVICPRGHDYGGHPACDSKPWGAYAVGAVFAQGAAAAAASVKEQAELEADAVDSFSRLLIDLRAWKNGVYGLPDLSSTGLRN
jgi:hypothetical protein